MVFIVKFEQIPRIVLVSLLLTLNKFNTIFQSIYWKCRTNFIRYSGVSIPVIILSYKS